MEDKVTEVRMRNTLHRRGYRLRRSRRKDPKALDYKGYFIYRQGEDGEQELVAGGVTGMTLDEVIRWVEQM